MGGSVSLASLCTGGLQGWESFFRIEMKIQNVFAKVCQVVSKSISNLATEKKDPKTLPWSPKLEQLKSENTKTK